MQKLVINGGYRLKGRVRISGAKNAALPIMAAALLSDDACTIRNVPALTDVETMGSILRDLGVDVDVASDGSVHTCVRDESSHTAPYDAVRKMRASVALLGPLLAKRGRARVSLPGGCVIGLRPIDLHLKGLRALGAKVEVEHGYVVAEAPRLRGAEIYLGGPFGSTVLGTANVMMAAVLARGTTLIENAACEPEVADLASFLNSMGAKIEGVGTPRLIIEGVDGLAGTDYTIIPDRIEAGTMIMAAAITRGDVTVENVQLDHLRAVDDVLRRVGVVVTSDAAGARVISRERFQPTDMATFAYPGFPTDLQAQLMALLSIADGISVITEKIYPDRFMHVAELNRLGARVRKEYTNAIINGVRELSGAPVMASDLRASAGLVLAGLAAKGQTEVHRIYHIDRGYERIEEKLNALGADIHRVEVDD